VIEILQTQQGASAYDQRVTLDGQAYILRLDWNGRGGAWYLSLYDDEGLPLLVSRKLSTNSPVLRRFRFVGGLPPGDIMACDFSAQIEYAGYSELGPGRGVTLYYFDAQEVADAAI
jgi:hypothetical protein